MDHSSILCKLKTVQVVTSCSVTPRADGLSNFRFLVISFIIISFIMEPSSDWLTRRLYQTTGISRVSDQTNRGVKTMFKLKKLTLFDPLPTVKISAWCNYTLGTVWEKPGHKSIGLLNEKGLQMIEVEVFERLLHGVGCCHAFLPERLWLHFSRLFLSLKMYIIFNIVEMIIWHFNIIGHPSQHIALIH